MLRLLRQSKFTQLSFTIQRNENFRSRPQLPNANCMRINFVITEMFVGGAERCLTELVLGLAETGDEVRVCSVGSLPSGPQRALVDRLEAAGIVVESAGADSVAQSYRAYRQLKDWFSATQPDVCQTFMYHANVLGTLAAIAAGIGCRVGGLRVADARPLRCQLERFAIRRMHSLVCVSEEVQQFAAQRLGCELAASTVIPNGVNVARFATANAFDWTKLGWPADAIVSLFLGRLHPQKGIELLQQEVETFAKPGTNRRLLLVGEGPQRNELQRWASGIGADRVQLLPWQADVAPLMRACRLLVLPSRYEGMPNVVLEAMAAGKPVVCSRVEGSRALLSHASELQSFPAGDHQAMKNLAEHFLSDEIQADEVGSINRSRVRTDFSIAAMVDAYRSHYRTLLTRRFDSE
jgi:glycosyltransferase involved in cell wall biosynthesis